MYGKMGTRKVPKGLYNRPGLESRLDLPVFRRKIDIICFGRYTKEGLIQSARAGRERLFPGKASKVPVFLLDKERENDGQ